MGPFSRVEGLFTVLIAPTARPPAVMGPAAIPS
jgi:hypothetical protein